MANATGMRANIRHLHWAPPRHTFSILDTASTSKCTTIAKALGENDAKTSRSLRSLDTLLGSYDDGGDTKAKVVELAEARPVAAPEPSSEAGTSKRRYDMPQRSVHYVNDHIEQPKCQPLVCYGLYYFQIVCYAAYLQEGFFQDSQSGDDFIASLLNDHISVLADGEVYRLITCSFVHSEPVQLFVMLLALFTLGSELEAIVGHSAFTAVYFLAVLTASSADCIIGNLPVTQGASSAIAGLLGAVLAHQIKNWSFELQVQDAQKSSAGGGGRDELETAEIDVMEGSLFEGWFRFTAQVPREGKVLLAVAGSAIASVQALVDAAQTDTYTSWTGLTAGLISGFVLAWFMSPSYKVTREVLSATNSSLESTDATGAVSSSSTSSSSGSSSNSSGSSGSGSSWGFVREAIVVTDQVSMLQRAAVVALYNGALYVVMQSAIAQFGK